MVMEPAALSVWYLGDWIAPEVDVSSCPAHPVFVVSGHGELIASVKVRLSFCEGLPRSTDVQVGEEVEEEEMGQGKSDGRVDGLQEESSFSIIGFKSQGEI